MSNMQQSEQQSPEVVSKAKKNRFNLTLIIAILALVIGIFVAIESRISYRDVHVLFKSVDQDLAVTQAQTHRTLKNVNKLQAILAHTQTQVATVQQLGSGNQKAWVLAEINYLVRLANYNLLFVRDIPAAIALLQTADQRLAMLDDPAFVNLRQQLADNIARLQAIPKVDLEGILMQLNALIGQSKQLPVIAPPSFVPQQTVEPKSSAPAVSGWRKGLQNSLDTLQTLVIIRRHNHPISPLLDSEQQLFLQQNLQLLLEQAQWAALHGQVNIYQNSLRQAESYVQVYFAQDAAATRAFRHALDELQKIDIQPKLPDITALLQEVQQTANRFNRTANN